MSLCFYTLHIDSRNSDLIIAARVDPSKSLALCVKIKIHFMPCTLRIKKGHVENWISK